MSATASPTRRDVLLLRAGTRERHADLSCRALHLEWLDLARTRDASAPVDAACYEDPAHGEPPLHVAARSPADVFDDLARRLEGVDVVHLRDRSWIADAQLARFLDQLVSRIVSRGGRVELT